MSPYLQLILCPAGDISQRSLQTWNVLLASCTAAIKSK